MPREQIMLFSCWVICTCSQMVCLLTSVPQHMCTRPALHLTQSIFSAVSINISFSKPPGDVQRGALVNRSISFIKPRFPICFIKSTYMHTPSHFIFATISWAWSLHPYLQMRRWGLSNIKSRAQVTEWVSVDLGQSLQLPESTDAKDRWLRLSTRGTFEILLQSPWLTDE